MLQLTDPAALASAVPPHSDEDAPTLLGQLDPDERLAWASIYLALLRLTKEGYSVAEVGVKFVATMRQVRDSVGF